MSTGLRERLIVFTRYPQPGTTKTRLISTLGTRGAADLQRRMTERVVSKAKDLLELRSLHVEIRFDGGEKKHMRTWLGKELCYRHQGEGDIGRRMQNAFVEGFRQGNLGVVIIGSDIPDITCDILQKAFESLKNSDLVLGPAGDGGYYLIGLHRSSFKRSVPLLFDGIPWGTDKVLAQSLVAAGKLGLNYILLDTLNDVDRPEDLAVWDQALQQSENSPSKKLLSVIVPTLNESSVIGETMKTLVKSKEAEIIVVDGGSRDNTVELAKSFGVRVLSTLPSKAMQMNVGAADASGNVFLFLHADTRLPDKFDEKVLKAATQNSFSAGAFTLGIDSDLPGLRFIERAAGWRTRFLKMPYGDQAIFVSRVFFNAVGGFPEIPIMEDFELVRRLKRMGKIIILPESVQTSPRRWHNFGVFKTWLLNQIVIIGYYIGIPPSNLARWYRRERGKSGG
jgi:rSAM/selenodomain-associated transferase 2/rSAM/selenodomain-associated transferase 1